MLLPGLEFKDILSVKSETGASLGYVRIYCWGGGGGNTKTSEINFRNIFYFTHLNTSSLLKKFLETFYIFSPVHILCL